MVSRCFSRRRTTLTLLIVAAALYSILMHARDPATHLHAGGPIPAAPPGQDNNIVSALRDKSASLDIVISALREKAIQRVFSPMDATEASASITTTHNGTLADYHARSPVLATRMLITLDSGHWDGFS